MSRKNHVPGPVAVFFGYLSIASLFFSLIAFQFTALAAFRFMQERPGVPVPISIRQEFMVSWLLTLGFMGVIRLTIFVHDDEAVVREQLLRRLIALFFAIGFSMLVVMARSIRILD